MSDGTDIIVAEEVNQPEPGRCNAERKVKGPDGLPTGEIRYCRAWPVRGRARCKNHGGLSLAGPDHPSWRGRSWSKFVPSNLADRFAEAVADQELAGLRAELALIDTHIGDLLEALPRREGPSLWDQIKSLLRKGLGAAEDARPIGEVVGFIDQALSVAENATGEAETWARIYAAVELRRRLADTERKRDEVLQATMTAKQAMAFFGALQVAIQEEVPDPAIRARLGARVRRLLYVEGPTPAAVRTDGT